MWSRLIYNVGYSHKTQDMITVGILGEQGKDKRVCLLPEQVKKVKDLGVEVIFESHAGKGLGIYDVEYQKAGAVSTSSDKIFDQADVVCSIQHRFDQRNLDTLTTFLGVYNPLYFREELRRYSMPKASVFSLDLLPRSTVAQNMDVLSSMASLSGYKSVLMAANNFRESIPMLTTAAGTLQPARFLILGAGVAGLQAVATAKRLGAIVEVFDVRKSAGEEVKSLGAKFMEVSGGTESNSNDGYAVIQSEEYRHRQSQLIHERAIQSDVVICAANVPGKNAPVLLEAKTLDEMKDGAIVIDLASEQGGNCRLSQNLKTVHHKGVTIIGDSQLARTLPMAASKLLSNNFYHFLKLLIQDRDHPLVNAVQVVKQGEVVHPKLREYFTQNV